MLLDLGLLGAKAADAMALDDRHARQRLLEAQRERLDHRVHVGAVDADLGGREVERRAWVIARERQLLAHERSVLQSARRARCFVLLLLILSALLTHAL